MTRPDRLVLEPVQRADVLASWLRDVLGPGAELRCDSRTVRPGDAFFAWSGSASDGRLHCADALRRGAAALLEESAGDPDIAFPTLDGSPGGVPQLAVPGLRALAGEVASRFYGLAASRLRVVAVTGTNGKTTTTHWIAQGLNAIGRSCGLIGTLGFGWPDKTLVPFGLTMPDVLSLHGMLRMLEQGGALAVAMEATSIGLQQGRLDGVQPSVAVLTNLTRDHLDYHGSLEAYARAKLRLFECPGLGCAVVNGDDPIAARVLATIDSSCPAIAFGETVGSCTHPELRHLIAERVVEQADGIVVSIAGDFGRAELLLPITGRFNVSNALAAGASWLALGEDFNRVVEQWSALAAVPGRLQCIGGRKEPLAVVDYAHTPDALGHALEALRPVARERAGRLVCVFGAGGGRDRGKRPMMGAQAERLADLVVLTSDNPREESPEAILADIEAGMQRPPAVREPDRGRAIDRALLEAASADVVLIAGRGHEAWQEIGGHRIAFSDAERARQALVRRAHIAQPVDAPGSNVQLAGSSGGRASAGQPERLFTLRQAYQWLSQGFLHGEGTEWVCAVVTDSRRMVPGCLFVALSGERFDGHDFIGEAHAKGAAAVLYDRWRGGITLPAIGVSDSRVALGEIAAGWRARFQMPLASVAGSNGKTTVKEMLASICRAAIGSDAVLSSPGNDNNEIGVAQTLLSLREFHRLAVLELGMNHPGEMAWLAAMARPTVALVNNAQREHQEFIAGTRGSARENAESFAFLGAEGVAVFPGDDPEHSPAWREAASHCRTLEFGLVDQLDPDRMGFLVCARRDAEPSSFELRIEGRSVPVALAIAGAHNIRNALAAAACAHAMGLDSESIRVGLERFRPVPGRLVECAGLKGIRLIDDTYNANPDSVRAAIDVLAASGRTAVLVLGDMGEVGEQGPLWHAEVGAYAHERGVAALFALGEATRESVRAFGPAARHFSCLADLVSDLRSFVQAEMVVLVKGSRFMQMERVVTQLQYEESR